MNLLNGKELVNMGMGSSPSTPTYTAPVAKTVTPVAKEETEQERLRKKKASATLLTGSQGAALEAGDTQAKSLLGQ